MKAERQMYRKKQDEVTRLSTDLQSVSIAKCDSLIPLPATDGDNLQVILSTASSAILGCLEYSAQSAVYVLHVVMLL